jgi:hypothetical protein
MGDVNYTNSFARTGDAFDAMGWTLFSVELITSLGESGPFGNDNFDFEFDIIGKLLWVGGGPSSTDPATLLGESFNGMPWHIVSLPAECRTT